MHGSWHLRLRRTPAALAFALVAAVVVATPAAAATTFTVDTTTDSVDAAEGDGLCADASGRCSLRAAVMEANSTAGDDTVLLPDGTYVLTIAGTGGDDDGDLDLLEALTVRATGDNVVVEAGTGFGDRIFDVQNAGTNLVLEGFTIRKGTAPDGGAVRFDAGEAALTLDSMVFTENRAPVGDGGAVFVKTGTLTVAASSFSSNEAGDDGGAISHGFTGVTHGTAPATITGSTFTGNAASRDPAGNGGDGGAIHAVGPLTVTGSTFQDNDNAGDLGDNGGAIRSEADLIVGTSTFSGNSTRDFGGAIDAGLPQAGSDQTDVSVTISETTFSTNSTVAGGGGDGGAIYTKVPLNVAVSSFSANVADDDGGAVYVLGTTASVVSTTFAGNTSSDFGGALEVDSSTITLRESAFWDNTAKDGGALSIDAASAATMVNSTLSGNTATDDGAGVHAAGDIDASFVTVAQNTATDLGGGLHLASGTSTFRHSIVAENSPSNCSVGDAATLVAAGTNLSDDATCTGFTQVADVGLLELADNGGPTRTHALETTSPAVDAASDCTSVDGATVRRDQRGASRPADGDTSGTAACDVGAFELGGTQQAAIATLTLAPDTTSGTVGDEHTVTATVEDSAGDPVVGAQVRFEVTGANGVVETAVTGSDGTASLTYTATNPGDDTITACTDQDGSLPSSCDAATGPTSTATASWVPPAQEGQVTRLAGADRWKTAIDVSRQGFPDGSVETVVLARGDNGTNDNGFADALAGSPLAAALGVPLLITVPDRLLPEVESEIQRLLGSSGRVILLGGTAALNAAVEARLDELGYTTDRLAGSDRIATSLAVAQAAQSSPQAILITRGWAFPDALSAGPAAANANGVVILNGDGERSAAVDQYLDDHPDATVYAIGGQIAGLFPEAVPVFGKDRFETAVEVAERFFGSPTVAGLARADTFPDSLSGGAHIGWLGGPILLTLPPHLEASGQPLHPSAENYICQTGSLTTGYVYGGTQAVSAEAEAVFRDRLKGQGCG